MGFILYPKRRLKKLVRDGEYIEALEFGKSIESKYSTDPDYMFIMASTYYIVEDAKRALPYFEKSVELKSDDVDVLTLKTNVHLSLEQKDKAIECCNQIIKLDPENFEAHGLLEKLESL